MGKWESLMKTGINLIEELGILSINETIKEKYQKEFGAENYIIKHKKANGRIVDVSLRLTKAESLRRSRGERELFELPTEEVTRQLKNIPKWRVLSETISQMRSTKQSLKN